MGVSQPVDRLPGMMVVSRCFVPKMTTIEYAGWAAGLMQMSLFDHQ
jgi:hypothetical protein